MVPNSPIHPDAAMEDNSRDVSPTKGNRTPGRKLSPPKHLEAPIVEVTENDSANEESKEQPAAEEHTAPHTEIWYGHNENARVSECGICMNA